MLEPFSGYKLVTGHGLFHLALFIVTMCIEEKDITITKYDNDSISYAFDCGFRGLQYAHAWVAFFSFYEEWTLYHSMHTDDNGF
jgi:hypothetical protein